MTHPAPKPGSVPDDPTGTQPGAPEHVAAQRRPVAPHVAALAGLAALVLVAVLATIYRHIA